MSALGNTSKYDNTTNSRLFYLCCLLSLSVVACILSNELSRFPLYFFCDEAIHGVEARSLLATGRDTSGAYWPLFIRGFGAYQLSLSVYLHVLVQSFLPLSEFSVRLVGVCSGMLFCATGIFLTRSLFGACDSRSSHTATYLLPAILPPLLIVTVPFFYLHFRTGFEFVLALSCWLLGIAVFHRAFDGPHSRTRSITILLAFISSLSLATSFYTYTPARGWVPLTVLVLLISYHRQLSVHKWGAYTFAISVGVLAIPFVCAFFTEPEMALGRLHDIGVARWQDLLSLPLSDILGRGMQVADPSYWLSWNGAPEFESSERHAIPELPLLPRFFLPLVVIGAMRLYIVARHSPLATSLLLAYPVGVFPAALVEVTPLRCAPIGALLTLYGCYGAVYLCGYLTSRSCILAPIAPGAPVAITFYLLSLQTYAFERAPQLYLDYGFYGLQMGEKEVFRHAATLIDQGELVILSHAGFNGNEKLASFYLSPTQRRRLKVTAAIFPCLLRPFSSREVWILREERYQIFLRDQHLCQDFLAKGLQVVFDPVGQPLFRILSVERKENLGSSTGTKAGELTG